MRVEKRVPVRLAGAMVAVLMAMGALVIAPGPSAAEAPVRDRNCRLGSGPDYEILRVRGISCRDGRRMMFRSGGAWDRVMNGRTHFRMGGWECWDWEPNVFCRWVRTPRRKQVEYMSD